MNSWNDVLSQYLERSKAVCVCLVILLIPFTRGFIMGWRERDGERLEKERLEKERLEKERHEKLAKKWRQKIGTNTESNLSCKSVSHTFSHSLGFCMVYFLCVKRKREEIGSKYGSRHFYFLLLASHHIVLKQTTYIALEWLVFCVCVFWVDIFSFISFQFIHSFVFVLLVWNRE